MRQLYQQSPRSPPPEPGTPNPKRAHGVRPKLLRELVIQKMHLRDPQGFWIVPGLGGTVRQFLIGDFSDGKITRKTT